jgi:uncharacterized protein
MYIIRDTATNWNKFGWYEKGIEESSPTQRWQVDLIQECFSKNSQIIVDTQREYKYSAFNIRQHFDDADVIFNTASEGVVILNNVECQQLDNYINKKDVISDDFLLALFNLGVLVFAEDREFDKFHYIRKRAMLTYRDIKTFVFCPTYECNARCFFCFSHEETKTRVRMTFETADEALQFIYSQTKSTDEVIFLWFGGEPLMATDIMDYIIGNFNNHYQGKIKYHSVIQTNASLLTDEIILEAKGNWNVKDIQISLEGFQETHNKRKNYYRKDKNYYEIALVNIEKLLKNDIHILCRLHLDHNNISDFPKVLDDLEKFKKYKNFQLYTTTLHIPEHTSKFDRYVLPNEYNTFYTEIFTELFKRGFYNDITQILPKRKMIRCIARSQNCFLIGADGLLFRCEQENHIAENSVGDCKTGVIHNDRLATWMDLGVNEECEQCQYLPICQGGCKYYWLRNKLDISPCIRPKFYFDTLMKFIYEWYKKQILCI